MSFLCVNLAIIWLLVKVLLKEMEKKVHLNTFQYRILLAQVKPWHYASCFLFKNIWELLILRHIRDAIISLLIRKCICMCKRKIMSFPLLRNNFKAIWIPPARLNSFNLLQHYLWLFLSLVPLSVLQLVAAAMCFRLDYTNYHSENGKLFPPWSSDFQKPNTWELGNCWLICWNIWFSSWLFGVGTDWWQKRTALRRECPIWRSLITNKTLGAAFGCSTSWLSCLYCSQIPLPWMRHSHVFGCRNSDFKMS